MNTLGLILRSRKVWIALAAVMSCIVVVVGADPEKWAPLIGSIVTLAGVVIGAIALEDASAKFGQGGVEPEPLPPSLTGERTSTLPALLIASLIGVSLIGCASNVREGQDPIAVNAEKSVQSAFEAVDSFLTFEDQNRMYVREKLPEIHAVAEQLRGEDTKNAFRLAWAAVRAYEQQPTPENQSNFETQLARVQSLARTARESLAQLQPLLLKGTSSNGNDRTDQPHFGRAGDRTGGDSEAAGDRQAGRRAERRTGQGVRRSDGEGVRLVSMAARHEVIAH